MRPTYALFLTLAFCPFAAAQSFDCKFAQSPREHAVCSDENLAALDTAVAAAYKSLRSQLSPESAAVVQSDQSEWLHWLDLVCPAHGKGAVADQTFCLQSHYVNREHDLERIVRVGNTVIFPRARFTYKPAAKPGETRNPNDPGFGYSSLCWPQIDINRDRRNPAYAAFNEAIEVKADDLNTSHAQDNDDSLGALGAIDSSYSIEAVNGRFIDVTLTNVTYGWGAAHPSTDLSSFHWWFDRNRELTISDVFRPGSDWVRPLAILTIANLHSQANLRGMLDERSLNLWLNDPDAKAHPDDAFDPGFVMTRDGLTVTFAEHQIGPYGIGMPQAHIPWTAIKRYLSSSLNPTTLPAPTPKLNP